MTPIYGGGESDRWLETTGSDRRAWTATSFFSPPVKDRSPFLAVRQTATVVTMSEIR